MSSDANFKGNGTSDFFKSLLNLRNKPYLVWSYKESKLNNKLLGNIYNALLALLSARKSVTGI